MVHGTAVRALLARSRITLRARQAGASRSPSTCGGQACPPRYRRSRASCAGRTVSGATGYQVWYPDVQKSSRCTRTSPICASSTPVDSWYSTVSGASEPSVACSATRPNGLPAVSYGRGARSTRRRTRPSTSGSLADQNGIVGSGSATAPSKQRTSSCPASPSMATGTRQRRPPDGTLYRAYAATDRDCVKSYSGLDRRQPRIAPSSTGPLRFGDDAWAAGQPALAFPHAVPDGTPVANKTTIIGARSSPMRSR